MRPANGLEDVVGVFEAGVFVEGVVLVELAGAVCDTDEDGWVTVVGDVDTPDA
ncbi:MAG: hypothetical protein P4L49_12855 [Desulfosporosinus sp.]|nr:hypothetical protein [Desulfosporosinus sp.]